MLQVLKAALVGQTLHLPPQWQWCSYTHKQKATLHIQELLRSDTLTTQLGYVYDCKILSESSSVIKKEHLTIEKHNGGLTFPSLQVCRRPPGAPRSDYGSHFKTWWLRAGRGLNSLCTSSRIQWPARYWGESDYNNTLFVSPYPICMHVISYFLGHLSLSLSFFFPHFEKNAKVRNRRVLLKW